MMNSYGVTKRGLRYPPGSSEGMSRGPRAVSMSMSLLWSGFNSKNPQRWGDFVGVRAASSAPLMGGLVQPPASLFALQMAEGILFVFPHQHRA